MRCQKLAQSQVSPPPLGEVSCQRHDGEGSPPALPHSPCAGAAGTLPPPLTNAAERGTIEIEKESLPVRRLARFIYYLEKVADSLAGRLLFHAFEQFHHQCNDDSEYHQHNGEQLKITHEVTLPSTRLPTGGYVNRKSRLPGKGQPPENSVQAVLPVDCASSLLVPFLGRLPHGIPCTSRIADISMDCNRTFGGGEEAPSHNTKGHPGRNWVPFFFARRGELARKNFARAAPISPIQLLAFLPIFCYTNRLRIFLGRAPLWLS